MAAPAVLSLRPATEEDRSRLANLLHFETHVHRHLDWRRPLDWLGSEPFLVTETGGRLTGALATPPDPPQVAWLRLFAVSTRLDVAEVWAALWPAAREQLLETAVDQAAAIPLQDWFRKLLSRSRFEHTHNVVVLDWHADGGSFSNGNAESLPIIRPIKETDIPAVYEVDRTAFAPLWQNSLDALGLALKQAGSATLIEEAGKPVAYQISTIGTQGLHLARLATHPDFQGRGLALALVKDLQQQVLRRSEMRLSVNTQDNNFPSLSLYKKLGFKLTRDRFPVYQQALN